MVYSDYLFKEKSDKFCFEVQMQQKRQCYSRSKIQCGISPCDFPSTASRSGNILRRTQEPTNYIEKRITRIRTNCTTFCTG